MHSIERLLVSATSCITKMNPLLDKAVAQFGLNNRLREANARWLVFTVLVTIRVGPD